MTGTGTFADPFIISNWEELKTAVNTTDAYVEFLKQLVRTTDTTVDENKLYVDSNGDVIKNPKNSEISSYYENTFAIDFNDIAPYGYDTANYVTLTCLSLNACGGALKNLHLIGSSGESCLFYHRNPNYNGSAISNLAMPNLLIEDAAVFKNGYSDVYTNEFSSCQFSGRISGSTSNKYGCILKFSNRYGSILKSATSCGFNLELSGYANWSPYNYVCPAKICRFELTGSTEDSVITGGENNYIKGNLDNAIEISSSEKNSIYDITVPAITGSNENHTIVNSDKCANIASGIISGTTAQLKDADWLRAQGFLIQTRAR